jgi:hypothetical protein
MVTHVEYVRISELVERLTVCNLTEKTFFFFAHVVLKKMA